jgi:hypothetical protein
MSWLSLLRLVLQLAVAIAGIVRSRQLLGAGEAQELARSLAATQKRLGIAAQVAAEVEALSDEDLNAELRGDR